MSGGRAPCSAGFGSSRIRRGPRAPQRAALCVLRASGSPGWLRDGEPNQASLRPIVRLKLRRSALLSLPCSRTGRPSELTEAPTVEAPRLRSGQPPCSLCLACPAPANLSRAFSIEKFLALELHRASLTACRCRASPPPVGGEAAGLGMDDPHPPWTGHPLRY